MSTWGDNKPYDEGSSLGKYLIAGVFAVTLIAVGIIVFSRPERIADEPRDTSQSVSDENLPVRFFMKPVATINPATLVASLEGFGISEEDVNLELTRNGLSVLESTGTDRKTAIDTIATRILLAGQAIRLKLQEDPRFEAELRAFYLERLSARFLQEKLAKEVEVSASEVRAFIRKNPALFDDRTYYTFDTISIPTEALDKIDTDKVDKALSLDEVIDDLRAKDIPFRRLPFASYTEELPNELIGYLAELEQTGKPFYLKNGGRTNIAVIMDTQAVPIAAERQFELARERLLATKKSEALEDYEREILEKSKPDYERGLVIDDN